MHVGCVRVCICRCAVNVSDLVYMFWDFVEVFWSVQVTALFADHGANHPGFDRCLGACAGRRNGVGSCVCDRGKLSLSACLRSFVLGSPDEVKVAPSFWFLNINMPIFLLKPFPNCLRKTWFKFLGGSPSKCWPNSGKPVFVCTVNNRYNVIRYNVIHGYYVILFVVPPSSI